jgi:hypothetical protein
VLLCLHFLHIDNILLNMQATRHHRKTAADAEKLIMNDLVDFIFDGDGVKQDETGGAITCPNHEKGCEWVGQNKNQVRFHLCQYEVIGCKEQLCATKFERRFTTQHELFCRHTLITCKTCGRRTNQINYNQHLEKECVKYHSYQKNLSGKWEMFWNYSGSIDPINQAFERSRIFSGNLYGRQKDFKLMEAEEKCNKLLNVAKEELQHKIDLLTKEKSLSNPETWSDDKLVKMAKKRRVKVKKKVKILVQNMRNSYEKEYENTYKAYEKSCLDKIHGIATEWTEKIDQMEEMIRKRQMLAEKRYEVHKANFPVTNKNGNTKKKKYGVKRRGGRRKVGNKSKSPTKRNNKSRPNSRQRSNSKQSRGNRGGRSKSPSRANRKNKK